MISIDKNNYVEQLDDIRKMFESIPRSVGRLTACDSKVVIMTVEVVGGCLTIITTHKGIDIQTPFGWVRTTTLKMGVSSHEGLTWLVMFLLSGLSLRGSFQSIKGE